VVLAAHRDPRIKASRQVLERSLRGDWRTEHVLVLELAFASWEQLRVQMARLDGEIAKLVALLRSEVAGPTAPLSAPAKRRSVSANQPAWEMRPEFHRVFGTDLTAIPGISSLTVQTLLKRSRSGLQSLSDGPQLRQLAGALPRYQNYRREGHGRSQSTRQTPVGSSPAPSQRLLP